MSISNSCVNIVLFDIDFNTNKENLLDWLFDRFWAVSRVHKGLKGHNLHFQVEVQFLCCHNTFRQRFYEYNLNLLRSTFWRIFGHLRGPELPKKIKRSNSHFCVTIVLFDACFDKNKGHFLRLIFDQSRPFSMMITIKRGKREQFLRSIFIFILPLGSINFYKFVGKKRRKQ